MMEAIRRNPQIPGLFTAACIYITSVLFFCIYAWFNPDGDCYAHLEGRHVSDMDDDDSIDVALLFHNWFVDFVLLLTFPILLILFVWAFNVFFPGECDRAIGAHGHGLQEAHLYWVAAQVLVYFAFHLWVVFWGYGARYSDPGMACSGDFYTKDDEPEPYLWSSGKVIANVVTFYMFLIAVIVTVIVIIILWIVIPRYLNKR